MPQVVDGDEVMSEEVHARRPRRMRCRRSALPFAEPSNYLHILNLEAHLRNAHVTLDFAGPSSRVLPALSYACSKSRQQQLKALSLLLAQLLSTHPDFTTTTPLPLAGGSCHGS